MLTVLRAVAEGQVQRDVADPSRPSYHLGWKVTRTVNALFRRELITPGERDRRWVFWEPTVAGRDLLNRLDGAT
jgi:hypothetical protein